MSFLRVVSNAEMVEEEEAALLQAEEQRAQEMWLSSLAGRIRRQWETNKQHRASIDKILDECKNARNSVYDPDVKREIEQTGGSDIYLPLTQQQCVTAVAWLADILLGPEKPWGVDSTPIPELPAHVTEEVERRLQMEIQQAQQAGVNPPREEIAERSDEARDKVLKNLREYAKRAASKMEKKIEDQLIDSDWEEAMEQFLDDFVTYPAAFIKTTYVRKRKLAWQNGQPVVSNEPTEHDERVSPYDIFPSPGQAGIQDGNLIERMRFTRDNLYNLIGVPGYSEEKLRAVLEEYDHSLREWQTSWDDFDDWKNEDGLITGVHYWGSAQGLELLEWGMPPEMIEDPLMEFQIDAILIGQHVIRAAINDDPLNRRPYRKACYRNNPGSFWGTSIPMLARGHSRMCNAAGRALSNNLGIASGPQIIVNVDRLPVGESITDIHPLKKWQVTDGQMATSGNTPPISFFQPDSNAGPLLQVLEYFSEQVGELTGISKVAMGVDQRLPQGAQTATGMAMLLENSSKTIKNAIRHIDAGVIRPRIEWQYDTNMLLLDDESLKGDVQIVARGATALIAKAATQARRNEFMQMTANPVDMELMGKEGRAELLRETAKDLDFQDNIPTREELQQKAAQASQQQPPPDPKVQVEQMRQQGRIEDQKLEMQDHQAEREHEREMQERDLADKQEERMLRNKQHMDKIHADAGRQALGERKKDERMVYEVGVKRQLGSGI